MKTAKRILYILLTLPLPFLCLADCDSPVDPDPPYDGPWEKVEVPEGIGYFALDFLSPTDGWSCGYGSVGHWDGSNWKIAKSFGDENNSYILKNLYIVNENNIWFCGRIEQPNKGKIVLIGVILHYDGNNWSETRFSNTGNISGINMFDDNTGWAGAGSTGGLLYFDGTSWTQYSNLEINLFYFFNRNSGWACGLSSIYHWDGTEWTESLADGNVWFHDIYFNAPDDGWTVSGASLYGFATHYHWDGTEWTKIEGTPFDQKSLDAIHFVDSEWGWIIGSGRTYFYNGVTWKEYSSGLTYQSEYPVPVELRDVYCNSKSDVWISTDVSNFLHFTTF